MIMHLKGGAIYANGSFESCSPAPLTDAPARARRALPGGQLRPLPFAPVRFALRRSLLVIVLLFLILFTEVIASWPVVASSTAFALAFNTPHPRLPAPAWLHASSQPSKKPDLNVSSSAIIPSAPPTGLPPRGQGLTMQPARLVLTDAAEHFVSSDGQLSVDIPAGSLTASQLAQPGGVSLSITQVRPASGGLSSEHLFFGTYAFQFFTAQGQALSQVPLQHPFLLSYHLNTQQQLLVYQGQHIYALWNAVQPATSPPRLRLSQICHPGPWRAASLPCSLTRTPTRPARSGA